MKRVTLREIGLKLGMSHTGVSLALRGHASIPEATRQRVQALANEMGYRPDPALSALNAYRQANHAFAYQATVGWLNTFPHSEDFHRGGAVFHHYFEGAVARSEELGYKMEEFPLPDLASWKRLDRTLRNRRIEGLLVPPPPSQGVEGYAIFPWQNYFALAVGTTFGLSLHLVVNNQFQSAALALSKLHELGYRRIGILMSAKFATHTEFHFLGGYQSECTRLKLHPHLLMDDSPNAKAYRRNTLRWLREQKLDAVIAAGAGDILPTLELGKIQFPDEIAIAFLARDARYPQIAGIDQNNRQIGITSANHLIDLIRRNERGIPDLPIRHLIPGTWVDGTSAPPRSAASA